MATLHRQLPNNAVEKALEIAKEFEIEYQSLAIQRQNAQDDLNDLLFRKEWIDWTKKFRASIKNIRKIWDPKKNRKFPSIFIDRITITPLEEPNEHQILIDFKTPLIGYQQMMPERKKLEEQRMAGSKNFSPGSFARYSQIVR